MGTTESRIGLLDNARFWHLIIGPFAICYAIVIAYIGQFRVEHIPILGSFIILVYLPWTRPAIKLLLPFFLFGFLYDSLRFITPVIHAHVPIHVAEPYYLERTLFGIRLPDGAVVTLTEFFQTHTHIVMDVIAAIAYLFYVIVPFTLAFILLVKDRDALQRFAWAFLALNIIGFITYYVYPAAPPWYVEQYGLGPAIIDAPAHPARLAAVDGMLGIDYFQTVYSRSSNVFAALPSLHVAFPMLAWLYARKIYPRTHWFFCAFWLTVCCSAVYLRHHYLIDVLLGVAYGAIAYFGIEAAWKRLLTKQLRVVATS